MPSGELTAVVAIPGGELLMGSTGYYADEQPVHTVVVHGFRIETHPVTNAQFAAFVDDSGYVTVAEQQLDPVFYPDVAVEDLQPGALVFRPTSGPVPLTNWRQWWHWQPGASWRHPFGPGSDLAGKTSHPVVQVSYVDAAAYAAWAGRSLPTEPEWELAARGGLVGKDFAWGDDARPDGDLRANTWQGRFPYENLGAAGWAGTSPVGTFASNEFGLVDMIGNVWEWTADPYTERHDVDAHATSSCCAPSAVEARTTASMHAASTVDPAVRKVLKGGSHLCAPEYCLRYRPAARSPQAIDSATTHIGFRCVIRSHLGPPESGGRRSLLADWHGE
ncbi:formylglycine-generating enzyme family protein [Cellulomonas sp. P22]|uniref:formylglycine-generating enzyme family protein n=1 Tax=Cellulomonas sp. P22 TaxID=3373189 RepID=UPI0037B3690F